MLFVFVEFLDELGVDGFEVKFVCFSFGFGFFYVVQYLFDFGVGKVSISQMAGMFVQVGFVFVFFELVINFCCVLVLLDNCIMDRFFCVVVLYYGCFFLVGDVDVSDVFCWNVLFVKDVLCNFQLGILNFVGVMFYLVCFGVNLGEFLLCGGNDIVFLIKENGLGICGFLVKSKDILVYMNVGVIMI